jgi:hypothetical protein
VIFLSGKWFAFPNITSKSIRCKSWHLIPCLNFFFSISVKYYAKNFSLFKVKIFFFCFGLQWRFWTNRISGRCCPFWRYSTFLFSRNSRSIPYEAIRWHGFWHEIIETWYALCRSFESKLLLISFNVNLMVWLIWISSPTRCQREKSRFGDSIKSIHKVC